MSPLYQSKRAAGTDERWKVIRSHFTPSDRSLLDLGCNLGVLTRKAAELGMTAVGVDAMPKAVQQAQRLHRGVPGLAFMQLAITPETVERLPCCDVVFCLSVHHYWVAEYGEDTAWSMIRRLITSSSSRFFFEPASRRKKYGNNLPAFTDLDKDSLESYHLEKLREIAGADRVVNSLGATDCIGPEPFRLMFAVSAK